jgi:aminoglycoside phosphotransferase
MIFPHGTSCSVLIAFFIGFFDLQSEEERIRWLEGEQGGEPQILAMGISRFFCAIRAGSGHLLISTDLFDFIFMCRLLGDGCVTPHPGRAASASQHPHGRATT